MQEIHIAVVVGRGETTKFQSHVMHLFSEPVVNFLQKLVTRSLGPCLKSRLSYFNFTRGDIPPCHTLIFINNNLVTFLSDKPQYNTENIKINLVVTLKT